MFEVLIEREGLLLPLCCLQADAATDEVYAQVSLVADNEVRLRAC